MCCISMSRDCLFWNMKERSSYFPYVPGKLITSSKFLFIWVEWNRIVSAVSTCSWYTTVIPTYRELSDRPEAVLGKTCQHSKFSRDYYYLWGLLSLCMIKWMCRVSFPGTEMTENITCWIFALDEIVKKAQEPVCGRVDYSIRTRQRSSIISLVLILTCSMGYHLKLRHISDLMSLKRYILFQKFLK